MKYSDGFEIFNVCTSNPDITISDDMEYFWYTEFANIKSTKGGVGGSLLHGNYKFFDIDGDLRIDMNYKLGIEHGNETRWDSVGNIISKSTYDNGILKYHKYLNENDHWLEFIGEIFKEGCIKNVYSKYGTLLSKETFLKDLRRSVIQYYEYPANKIQAEFTIHIGDSYHGLYRTYYKNGNTEVEGQFHDDIFAGNIRVGEWRWYSEDGTLESEAKYKAELEYWENGEIKVVGGYIYDTDANTWVRIGEWEWWNQQGSFIESKEYEWGIEIKK
ncbi:MAG: hypothetical protein JRJ57_04665 [Deltaproteobacteria bacterium]|nr:hypothetical protein [Deltaproteobacteria bacterium]